jgi:2,4-diaminopentanoate dehydrogenase
MTSVSIYGLGQLGNAVGTMLRSNVRYEVAGPFGREHRTSALRSGADLVIIATTTRLHDVAGDIEEAVRAGSNVLVSAEEAAFPFVVDASLAEGLDKLARERGVTIAGAGVNPGLMFDALVLTMLGAAPRGCSIHVRRSVDISGFGPTVLRRIGVGRTEGQFSEAVNAGEILGHAGFPQSMSLVAHALGVQIEHIDKVLRPVITDVAVDMPGRFLVHAGESAGVDQTYTAFAGGTPWFVSEFFGHVDLAAAGRAPSDDIELLLDGQSFQTIALRPGVNAQIGSANMVANSVERILAARAGWVTVAEMMPAYPSSGGLTRTRGETGRANDEPG